MRSVNRRSFLQSAAVAGGSCVAIGTSSWVPASAHDKIPTAEPLPAQTSWKPAPVQAPVKDGIASLPGGARLWYWDTGGSGDPVVLLHASTGSALSWEYQQPVLAKAGYRVIGYSTRGHYGSDPADPAHPGTGSGDLQELMQFLGIDRFHLIGTAAGGFTAFDYAVSHQDRLLSLMVANSFMGVNDPEFGKTTGLILPPSFSSLPPDFRELGPSYRAGYRAGVERWLQLVSMAGSGGQPLANDLQWPKYESLRIPVFVLTGDADLYMPPSRLREFVRHLRRGEMAVFAETGHSGFWEQPDIFNREMLKWLGRLPAVSSGRFQ